MFDWLRTPKQPQEGDESPRAGDTEPAGDSAPAENAGMSRRDFFARFAGRDRADEVPDEPDARDPSVLHTFLVARFPYHDGPVLVPSLRVGEVFRLAPEPPYSRDPIDYRIERGRDLLGFVPRELFEDVRDRLAGGERLICRASKVEPSAELSKILTVEIAIEDEAGQSEDAGDN